MIQIELYEILNMNLTLVDMTEVPESMGRMFETMEPGATTSLNHKGKGANTYEIIKVLSTDDVNKRDEQIIKLLVEKIPSMRELDEMSLYWLTNLVQGEIDVYEGSIDNEKLALKGCSIGEGYNMHKENLDRMIIYYRYLKGLLNTIKKASKEEL